MVAGSSREALRIAASLPRKVHETPGKSKSLGRKFWPGGAPPWIHSLAAFEGPNGYKGALVTPEDPMKNLRLLLIPLTLLALAALAGLVRRASTWRQAAMLGWCFGIGHFTLGNNWIATAFTYQANMPAWLGWVAVVLLSFYLAVYPALAALAGWLARRSVPGMVLALAGGWIVS